MNTPNNLEWLDKVDLLEFWNALDDHFSTELLTDEHADHIEEAIIRCFKQTIATKLSEAYQSGYDDRSLEADHEIEEAYKQGYIDSGIATLTNDKELENE